MSFFRRANESEVERVPTPDGEGFVDLKAEFSKGEVNKIIMNAPKSQDDIAGSLQFIERFAEIAVLDWSMTDEKGNKVPFSIQEYRRLHADAAKWLDQTLAAHLQKTIGKDVEELEGKPAN